MQRRTDMKLETRSARTLLASQELEEGPELSAVFFQELGLCNFLPVQRSSGNTQVWGRKNQ